MYWVWIQIILFVYILFLCSSYSGTVKTKARGILCDQYFINFVYIMYRCSFEEKDTMDWVDKQQLQYGSVSLCVFMATKVVCILPINSQPKYLI